MGHKCFISFKTEDQKYKNEIQSWSKDNKVDMIDKSLNTPIDSDDEDYIMRKIRQDYLADSTVTIVLIGEHSSEDMGENEQRFIKRELQASLYNGQNNTRSGILGVVLPSMYSKIYKGTYICRTCHKNHTYIALDDSTVIKEFWRNYYLDDKDECHYTEEDRYCVLARWDDFKKNPNLYIENAFAKRSQDIATKVVVYPK